MQVLGWEVQQRDAVIAIATLVGGGACCIAILKYLKSSKNLEGPSSPQKKTVRSPWWFLARKGTEGEPDPNLPLHLEEEYGDFKQTCLTANPTAASYLNDIPGHFFAFPQNFLNFITSFVTEHSQRYKKLLVIGSKTGFLVFGLANLFSDVKGVETSYSQVVTCYQFQNLNTVTHHFPSEGTLGRLQRSFKSPITPGGRFPLKNSTVTRKSGKENIEFINADIERQSLSYFGEYQVVVLQNCLENLDDPIAFLRTLSNIITLGGFLIISADYNWAKASNRQDVNSFDLLLATLQQDFRFEIDKNIPEVICSTVRSCCIRHNHVTAWVRITQ